MLKIQMETRNIVLTLEDETKFLIEIANQFGKEAQNILDFVAKTGNLEKLLRCSENPKPQTDRLPIKSSGIMKTYPMVYTSLLRTTPTTK